MYKNKPGNNQAFEAKLFRAADKLRKNIDAAEYKHIVLGLIFLNYISGSFAELHRKISRQDGEYKFADPEDADEYLSKSLFWIPPRARWEYLREMSDAPNLGQQLDKAMEAIENSNQDLRGILPKIYAKRNIHNSTLAGLMDLIEKAPISQEAHYSKDLLGRVYEYFLGKFALAEGQKGGQFYTPKSIVKLLVEMVRPFKGRIYDPCCGSGGMFVISEKFVELHKGSHKDISVFGQETNQTTYRLCCMNLAMHGIDSSQVIWNSEGSFLNDAHYEKKMDYILANPPFNDSDWSGQMLQDDPRWLYGKPPIGNANFAWVQHFIHHLNPGGVAGFVLANGSLSSNAAGGNEIRKGVVEDEFVDCIVNLPTKLFLNTQIPACLWFISRKDKSKSSRKIQEVLFINAEKLGSASSKRVRYLSDEDIAKIAGTFNTWKRKRREYKNIAGFCQSVSISKVRENNYILSPQRYIKSSSDKEDKPRTKGLFAELMETLERQLKDEQNLNKRVKRTLEVKV